MLEEEGCKAILLLSSFLVGARERRSKEDKVTDYCQRWSCSM